MIKQRKNIKTYFVYIFCITMIIIFHCLSYDNFGYYVDEIGSMYDAYCISNYGVDRWLDSFPIHLKNYGDGQCSLFVYILVVLFKLFGTSKFIIRSVPLLFHIITVIFISKIIGLYKKEYELYACLLTTITPIFYLLFQFGLESHFMIALCSLFFYFLLKAIENKKTKYFIVSGIIAGMTFYTYALSYIVIPIFLCFYLIYLIKNKKIEKKQCFVFIIPIVLLGFPLFIVQFINVFNLNQFTFLNITFPRFLTYRINELGFKNFFKNIYYTFLNTNFYDKTTHLCIPSFGNLYYISIPFIIIGFFKHLKSFKQNHISAAIILWTASNYIMASVLQETTINNTRLNSLFLTKYIYLICGIMECIKFIKKKWFSITLLSIYIIHFISFTHYYFVKYDLNTQSNLFLETYEDLPNISNTIYVPENYCYLLWSKKINPNDIYLNENGYMTYKNYKMGYYELNYDAFYLVSKYDNISQKNLEELGFKYEEYENYYLYSYQK